MRHLNFHYPLEAFINLASLKSPTPTKDLLVCKNTNYPYTTNVDRYYGGDCIAVLINLFPFNQNKSSSSPFTLNEAKSTIIFSSF